MSKARNIADNSSVSPHENLDGGNTDSLQDSNVHNTIELTGFYTFDGGTV
jgi:hypothetical protein